MCLPVIAIATVRIDRARSPRVVRGIFVTALTRRPQRPTKDTTTIPGFHHSRLRVLRDRRDLRAGAKSVYLLTKSCGAGGVTGLNLLNSGRNQRGTSIATHDDHD